MFTPILNILNTFYIELLNAAGESPFSAMGYIATHGGLILFFPLLVWMLWVVWLFYVIGIYGSKQKYVLFAVDVPSVNEQSMAAVEQVITALHGTLFNYTKKDLFWHGMQIEPYALEIVSIDGYIQYFVWSNVRFQNVLKSAIYAQYPDAEITEVEDYTKNVPNEYPNPEYKVWGTQLGFEKPSVYPIKTYEYFEHSLTGTFADPLASVLEQMSRLHEGEQVWLQLVLTPVGGDIRDAGIGEVNKLIGKDGGYSPTGIEKFIFSTLGRLFNAGKPAHFEAVDDAGFGREGSDGNFMSVTTGERVVIEEIQKKITRLQFDVKFRFVYIAKTEVYDRYRVPGSIFGALKQFNSLDLNSFRGGKFTTTSRPTYGMWQRRRHWRETKLVKAYQGRSNWNGEDGITMSSAEIATIFHFPLESTQAPLLSSTESKKAEPPTALPQKQTTDDFHIQSASEVAAAEAAAIPVNLPMDVPTKMRIPRADEALAPAATVPQQSSAPAAATQQVAVQAPQSQQPVSQPRSDFQPSLHSMPGLPPGVKPVAQWNFGSRAQMDEKLNARPQSIMPTTEEITGTVQQVAQKVTPEAVRPVIHAITDPIQQVAQAIPGMSSIVRGQQAQQQSPPPQPRQPQPQAQPQVLPQPVRTTPMQQQPSVSAAQLQQPVAQPQPVQESAGAPPQNLPI